MKNPQTRISYEILAPTSDRDRELTDNISAAEDRYECTPMQNVYEICIGVISAIRLISPSSR
jgi:hypothetical protein